jgi:hypothetical protein
LGGKCYLGNKIDVIDAELQLVYNELSRLPETKLEPKTSIYIYINNQLAIKTPT